MKTRSISFAISENEIAYVVLDRQKLIFWEVHTFLPDSADIFERVEGIVQRCIDRFAPNAVVLEESGARGDLVLKLHATLKDKLHRLGVPTFETGRSQLLNSFGLPALKNREELRRSIAAIFPEIPFARYTHLVLDAVALGLHFETDRLLALNHISE